MCAWVTMAESEDRTAGMAEVLSTQLGVFQPPAWIGNISAISAVLPSGSAMVTAIVSSVSDQAEV